MKQFLFITDLDYTLIGDDDAMAQLNQQLELHRQQYGTKIVYSTGRSPFLFQKLAKEKTLLDADILVCSVGTEIYINGSQDPDSTWSDKLSQAWDRDLVKKISANFPDLKPQPASEQRDFKVSYLLKEEIAGKVVPELERALLEQELDIQVIYSGGKDLDILPRNANKGMAMTFVRQYLEIDVAKTVACGDSGNDIALFANREEKGIIVGNARQELLDWHKANPNPNRYLATAKFANGIGEGLQYFGFLE
ncbi:sucrose-phosphate phosphatase [Fortiea sp. LEGE XX443]|uniref:sucrose-phosphate phosphatase n=1 Tax=Fortiea sp. LEGE XX443 TaxID=1828611 RepID=UPI001881E94E|nr:sucrose-phosphate phosphatase [Fortiea sp. LEGE XX443]MBE9005572.1 sucrose-phosphate phosphatase [Fortiea sp. LEGE XX443]